MHTICLKDNWTLTVLGKNVYDIPETPIETKVPSTVYGTLLEKGLIPDPFYRDNELDALKLMENDFAYETEIVIGEEDRKADRLFLHFDGIDTIADVYLNGEKIGSADNMNRVWEYDITDLVAGDAADTVYQVKVILHSPTKFIAEEDTKCHFQDLKRIIAAAAGKARRINVIMPFLYESRQHKRSSRESLDCALALQELTNMGVENIITFDAHDPRVQNAIPLKGFETVQPIYQFIKYLLREEKELQIDSDHMMVISPDEGGMGRAVYFANVLGLDMGMFYKRRDYTQIVNGRNPIVAHEFLGSSVEGKDVIIVDDMISSGESMQDVAKELKRRKARKVFICSTFGLFTNGLAKFDEYYENGTIDRILTTNLVYQTPDLLSRPYYINVDMSKYIALIIDNLNHDASLSELLNPTSRINRLLDRYRAGDR